VAKTDELAKNVCKERSETRHTAQTELEQRIVKVRNQNCLWPENILFKMVGGVLNTVSKIVLYFQPKNMDGISRWELKNLQLYYNVLYTPNTPKAIVNMLLKQKNDVEYFIRRN